MDWKFILRIIYFGLAIIVDIISSFQSVGHYYIHIITWILAILSLFPFPLYQSEQDNILVKLFIYIFPFYILLTRSYEALFLIIFYNYLQLWIKLEFRQKNEENKDTFNLIDIFMYMSLAYASCFSTGNIASISGFTLSSVFRFVSKYIPLIITTLIMIKILLPTLLVTVAHFEICRKYKYSSFDSIFMLIAFVEVMNIKFFFDIRDFGSWKEIGMSIAFFIISNVIAFLQFLMFIFVKFLFCLDNKYMEYEDIKEESILPPKPQIELELGVKNSNYNAI